jgi:hypothetical protein
MNKKDTEPTLESKVRMLFWEVSRMDGLDEDQRAALVSFFGLLMNKAILLARYERQGLSSTAIAFVRRVPRGLIGRVGRLGSKRCRTSS